MNVQSVIFYFLAATLLFAATMVITSSNPVRAVLFLVLAFVASTGIWLMLESEFLALVLIFVYVGAVMTLFLFVVMMINIDLAPLREGFVRFLPVGMLVLLLFVGLIIFAIRPSQLAAMPVPAVNSSNYSNVKELGIVLYTHYLYPFEIASALLLVAIIAAIALAHRSPRHSKTQNVAEQLAVNKKDRVYLVNMSSNKLTEGQK